MKNALLVIALMHGPIALADAITGEYWLDGQTLIDTPSDQRDDSHFYLRLEGESASTLYSRLDVDAVWNTCGTDHWEKRVGAISCEFYATRNNYYCYFSIDVRDGSLFYGPPC